MKLRALHVRDFRNLAEVELAPSPRATVLLGENGQGKTNLLEAVYVLTTLKPLRAVRLAELVRPGGRAGAEDGRGVLGVGLVEPVGIVVVHPQEELVAAMLVEEADGGVDGGEGQPADRHCVRTGADRRKRRQYGQQQQRRQQSALDGKRDPEVERVSRGAALPEASPRELYSAASVQVARAAARLRHDEGLLVVGVDLAGQEHGHPAEEHTLAYQVAHEAFLGKTVHAGEDYGPESIFQAIGMLHADRIGHGTWLFDESKIEGGNVADRRAYVERLAQFIADKRITIEVCLTSNQQTVPELGADLSRHPFGEMREVVEWDTGKTLGRIPQIPVTYQVVGNMNEHQVAIGETTFGGRRELKGPSGIIDYGSLMWLGLERGRTAREALDVMTKLVDEFGYASTGESISVVDPNEAWVLEIIGKGEKQKGAIWIAVKLPDGTISAHANQPRIRQFPRNDPKNALFSKDVVSFAREKGWFTGKDEEFSFADVYSPLRGGTLRGCTSGQSLNGGLYVSSDAGISWTKKIADTPVHEIQQDPTNRNNWWAVEELENAGYIYSSSIYPVRHDHYGMPDAPRFAHRVPNGLLELPITTTRVMARNLPAGGGGFFRLLPYRASKWAIDRVNRIDRQPAIFYFHPWEIDPQQPRVHGVGAKTRFRHYLNLDRTESRLHRLLADFRWDRIDRVSDGQMALSDPELTKLTIVASKRTDISGEPWVDADTAALAIGWGATQWWFTEFNAIWHKPAGETHGFDAWEWENRFQLTPTEKYPIDIGFVVEIERPHERAEGYRGHVGTAAPGGLRFEVDGQPEPARDQTHPGRGGRQGRTRLRRRGRGSGRVALHHRGADRRLVQAGIRRQRMETGAGRIRHARHARRHGADRVAQPEPFIPQLPQE